MIAFILFCLVTAVLGTNPVEELTTNQFLDRLPSHTNDIVLAMLQPSHPNARNVARHVLLNRTWELIQLIYEIKPPLVMYVVKNVPNVEGEFVQYFDGKPDKKVVFIDKKTSFADAVEFLLYMCEKEMLPSVGQTRRPSAWNRVLEIAASSLSQSYVVVAEYASSILTELPPHPPTIFPVAAMLRGQALFFRIITQNTSLLNTFCIRNTGANVSRAAWTMKYTASTLKRRELVKAVIDSGLGMTPLNLAEIPVQPLLSWGHRTWKMMKRRGCISVLLVTKTAAAIRRSQLKKIIGAVFKTIPQDNWYSKEAVSIAQAPRTAEVGKELYETYRLVDVSNNDDDIYALIIHHNHGRQHVGLVAQTTGSTEPIVRYPYATESRYLTPTPGPRVTILHSGEEIASKVLTFNTPKATIAIAYVSVGCGEKCKIFEDAFAKASEYTACHGFYLVDRGNNVFSGFGTAYDVATKGPFPVMLTVTGDKKEWPEEYSGPITPRDVTMYLKEKCGARWDHVDL